MPLEVPSRVRDLDAAWLTSMFGDRAIPGAPVSSVDLSPLGVGLGFAGRMVRLTLGYDGDPGERPRSLIAKLPAPAAAMREFMLESRGYEVEGRFYETLADDVPVTTPRAYWSGIDLEAGAFCLLLEDLSQHESADQLADEVDPDVIAGLLLGAARMHRRYWNSDALAALDWMPGPSGREVRALQRVALSGSEYWRDEFASAYPEEFEANVLEAIRRVPELADRAAANARTLVHGDYRLGNAMVTSAEGEPPIVTIDWQLTRFASGPYDIAYLLAQSVPTDQRREHEERWLAAYREELAQPGYTEEQLRDDLAIGTLQSTMVPLLGAATLIDARRQAAELPPGGTRDAFETAMTTGAAFVRDQTARAAAAIEDYDAFRMLR